MTPPSANLHPSGTPTVPEKPWVESGIPTSIGAVLIPELDTVSISTLARLLLADSRRPLSSLARRRVGGGGTVLPASRRPSCLSSRVARPSGPWCFTKTAYPAVVNSPEAGKLPLPRRGKRRGIWSPRGWVDCSLGFEFSGSRIERTWVIPSAACFTDTGLWQSRGGRRASTDPFQHIYHDLRHGQRWRLPFSITRRR